MKMVLKMVSIAFALIIAPAIAHAEPQVQYIDCSDANTESWTKTIIALDSESSFSHGTLFISYDVMDPFGNTGVLRLVEDRSARTNTQRVYEAKNARGFFRVNLPMSISGSSSDHFEASLDQAQQGSGSSYGQGLLCFSRMYPRPDSWVIPKE